MKLTDKDLVNIHSLAVQSMIQLPSFSLYQKDTAMAQTYAFTIAVIQFLNNKQVFKEDIEVDQKLNPKYEKE
jgi:hypothetical protein